jgi:hypothetical protein
MAIRFSCPVEKTRVGKKTRYGKSLEAFKPRL